MGEQKAKEERQERLSLLDNCGNCRFSMPLPDQPAENLMCRRYPPIIIVATTHSQPVMVEPSIKDKLAGAAPQFAGSVSNTTSFSGQFPNVHALECWCGEHKPKETMQ